MKTGIICFTAAGRAVCGRLLSHFRENGDDCLAWAPRRLLRECPEEEGIAPLEGGLCEWSRQMFEEGRAMIFIGAAGIAVRAAAPWVKDKLSDPPVVVLDEKARFAVPILSGHVGGGNRLALQIGEWLGSTPVITTATDVNGLFAVDVYAAQHGLVITDRREAKAISAAVLEGERIGFFSDFKEAYGRVPEGCMEEAGSHNIWITLKDETAPAPWERRDSSCLRLVPRAVVLGIGCRRGMGEKALEEQVLRILRDHQISLESVKALATIDIKKDEKAILQLAEAYGWELRFYEAERLLAVEGDFKESAFVARTVGVGNVCERAAAAEGGQLLIHKQAGLGITVAAALEP